MASNILYHSQVFTPPGGFPSGIEGPACDSDGNIYVVNYQRLGTIGKITPAGETSLFLTLPKGSIGNGIRFISSNIFLIADYTGHNILAANRKTRNIDIYAHEASLNQPNDIAIGANGIVYASDPDWKNSTGQIWRIGHDRKFFLLEANMGTTNGIEVSPDENKLYVNESIQRCIWEYSLNPMGEISNKRLLIEFPDYGLDGMRCDSQGNLFVTRWGKGVVTIVSPFGQILREINLHGKECTNLTFGGPDGCTIYVTVADTGNIEIFRTEYPGRPAKNFD